MKKRIITAIVLLCLFVPIVVMPNPSIINDSPIYHFFFIIFQIGLAILTVIASGEMIAMFEREKKFSKLSKYVTMGLTLLMFLNVGNYWEYLQQIDVPLINLKVNNIAVLVFSVFVLLSVFVFDTKFGSEDVGKSILIITYVGIGAASLAILKTLGVRFIIYVLLISIMTDVFAYFVGIKFGKHKMVPHISPKKSWEGALGGTIAATVIASVFAIFYGVIFTPTGFLGNILNPDGLQTIFDGFSSLGEARYDVIRPIIIVVITLLGSIAAQIGDLVASKFKRSYDIKDFGSIFPGHGGVLDRFDSILFISLLFVGIFLTIQSIFPIIS